MTQYQRLLTRARVAYDAASTLYAARRHPAAAQGGGVRLVHALASPEPPTSRETAETPGPPKRVGPEYPSAVPTNLQKKFQKKDPTARICRNCYYVRPPLPSSPGHQFPKQTCHANAPTASPTTCRSFWPEVDPEEWCGEWLSKLDFTANQETVGAQDAET